VRLYLGTAIRDYRPRKGAPEMSHSVDIAQGHETRAVEEGKMEKAVAHVLPGEGTRSLWVMDELLTYKVPSQQTGGAYSLFEVTTQPGPDRHPTSSTVRMSPSTCWRVNSSS
jgi:hypothetical protein